MIPPSPKNIESPKYRINAYLAEIYPTENRKAIRQEVLLRTGLSITSWNRKRTAKLQDEDAGFLFKPGHLQIILEALNKFRDPAMQLEFEDLLHPTLKGKIST